MFGTISFAVSTFGQQQAGTQKVSKGGGGSDPISYTNFRKKCMSCVYFRQNISSVTKLKCKTSNITLPHLSVNFTHHLMNVGLIMHHIRPFASV